MPKLRRGSAERGSELSPASLEDRAARYTFPCPRCAGAVSGLEDAGAVLCSFCGAAFFSSADRDTGWILSPRLAPAEAAAAARSWLRETGRRVRRLMPPRGLLLPVYWARGRHLGWELANWPGPGAAEASLRNRRPRPVPNVTELWEPRFRIQAFAHTFPAHSLASLLPGRHTRFESANLEVLDPDLLPEGFELVNPTVTVEQGEIMRDDWLLRRAGRVRGPWARVLARSRFHLVAFPVVVVPFRDPEGRRRMVLVDGVNARVTGEVPRGSVEQLDRLEEAEAPARRWRPPLLVPLECGQCGVPLAPESSDRLFGCSHCGAAWELSGGQRRAVRQWALEGRSTDRWLPFWVYGGEPGPEGLAPGAVLVPAYEARHPEAQLHLAARLCRIAPSGSWAPVTTEIRPGASLGSAEAESWRWAVTGALARSSLRSFLTFLRQAREAEPAPPRGLAWIPFRSQGGDLVELSTGARIRVGGTREWTIPKAA